MCSQDLKSFDDAQIISNLSGDYLCLWPKSGPLAGDDSTARSIVNGV